MPLSWDVSKVENFEEVCWLEAIENMPSRGIAKGERILNPATEALVWASISTGIGRITKENAAEIYARIKLTELLYGPIVFGRPGKKDGIHLEDVTAHIGLSTNASFKDKPRSTFLKEQAMSYLEDTRRAAQREIDRKTEPHSIESAA